MLNQLRVQLRGDTPEHFIDDALEYVHDDLRNSKNRLERDIYNIVSANRMDNNDADDFFQVALDVIVYGDLSAQEKRVDLSRDRDAYNGLIDSALRFAIAVFASTDREIADRLSRDDYDDFRQLENTYRKEILPVVQRAGRSNRRDARDDRRDIRDRRDDRRNNDTQYQTPRRDVRYDRRTPRRTNRDDDGTITAYGAGSMSKLQQDEPVRTRNNEPYAGMTALDHMPHHHEPKGPYGLVTPMENYEAHELRALQTPQRDRDAIIVPIVDFTRTPELAVKEVVEATPEIKELPDVITLITESEFPVSSAIADKLVGKQEITVYRAQQYRLRSMPVILQPAFEGMETFKSFEQWHKSLSTAMDIISRIEGEVSIYKAVAVSFVQSVNSDLTKLFNDLLAIVDDQGANLSSFVDHAKDAFDWLRSDDGADVYRLFTELEPEYLRHNYAVLSDEEVAKVNQSGNVLGPIGVVESIHHYWITTRILNVNYVGSMLSGDVALKPGKICNVEYNSTPDFYNACARIVRLRNTRKTMSQILLTDSVGHRIAVLAGKREGGTIRVKSFNS